MNETNRKNILFVGGVHGVGKTTFCKKMELRFSVQHYSASELIRVEKREIKTPDKRVKDINLNQNVLIRAINQHLNERAWSIIDGHFCLLNSDKEITKIPDKIFVEMSPKAILVIYDETEKICERLRQRDQKKYEVFLIEELQRQEIKYAQALAQELNIPYKLCDSSKSIEIGSTFLKELFLQSEELA